ncbi:MAG: Ppx/GppA phosphatase family protein [Proteobacteria bacterium]|nr:Ppx/GppA phosphatase family protein [Pseudomonadota bacterium]MDA0995028.1 Ppx/GppA phosphatase family protein [Pseudomonadota bacterium]
MVNKQGKANTIEATSPHSASPGSADRRAPDVLAAVDLGSNSFHMIVGELRYGQLTIIDRLKETVRLSEGLKDKGALSHAARQRALDCLSRFGERLRDMRASSVRTAGTSALRRASDSGDFLLHAELALGHPIEIISGIEEARLIYVGVSHSMPPFDGPRLVLDIGGGSTELILGHADTTRALESLHMGCVGTTEKYFPNGEISRKNFETARLAARLKLRPVKAFFRNTAGVESIGTSGTIISTEIVARELGVIESHDVTPDSVEKLIDRVVDFENTSCLALPGLPVNRAQVWPGGLAILVELLEVLRIDRLKVSDGALREGLLYDHLGRLMHKDARQRSVQALANRFNVDQGQADRVAQTARQLLSQVAAGWELQSELAAHAIDWGARLHEIGLDISHDGFQRHGAYIAENADLPGFPRSEQKLLAWLIASQRAGFDKSILQRLPSGWQNRALRLSILLRVAVLLNRSRASDDLSGIDASVEREILRLKFPRDWLDANPLTVADLCREQQFVGTVDHELQFG